MCKLCDERSKTWEGDDLKCAFDEFGNFNNDNWNCATMNQLREYAMDLCNVTRMDELGCTIGYVPLNLDYLKDDVDYENLDNGFIVMTWYKFRGRTNGAIFIDSNGNIKSVDINMANASIKTCKSYLEEEGYNS